MDSDNVLPSRPRFCGGSILCCAIRRALLAVPTFHDVFYHQMNVLKNPIVHKMVALLKNILKYIVLFSFWWYNQI